MKIQKKNLAWGCWVGEGGLGWGGQAGCKRRIEVFCENSKKKIFFFWGGGGSWGGVRVDVNEELKFL